MGTVSPWNATLSQLFLTIFQGDSEVHPHLSTVLKSCLKEPLNRPMLTLVLGGCILCVLGNGVT